MFLSCPMWAHSYGNKDIVLYCIVLYCIVLYCIHVNKQLIITMRINNNHADELILTEFTHFHIAHIYKQIADKILT